MVQEQQNQLMKLRDDIIAKSVPLIDADTTMDDQTKFAMILQVAQSQGSPELYARAYDSAQRINNDSAKLKAYLDLLGNIDVEIQTAITDNSQSQVSDDGEAPLRAQ